MVVLRNSKRKVDISTESAKVFQDLLKLEDEIDRDKEHMYVVHNRRQTKGTHREASSDAPAACR
jgi:hypothetical protein